MNSSVVRNSFLPITILVLNLVSSSPGQNLATQIAQNGLASQERLQTGAAHWTVTLALPNNPTKYQIKVIQDGPRTRYTGFVTPKAAKPLPIFTVVSETNRWFVMEAGQNVKARPWEHYFQFAIAELLMEAAELRFVIDASTLANAYACATNATSIEFRVSLPDAEKQRLSEVNEVTGKLEFKGNADEKARRQHQRQFFARLLQSGLGFSINTNGGFIDQFETQRFSLHVEDFKWLPPAATNQVRFPNAKFLDHTQPYAQANWNRCALVAHDPAVTQAQMQYSPRLGVLQLDRGTITRVPLPVIGTLWGCFLADRSRALVAYQDLAGQNALAFVNLDSGTHQPVPLHYAGKLIGMPILSPDKRTIALLSQPATAKSVLEFQMLTIDRESFKATPLGEPGRIGGPYAWLPDGSGIVLKRFLPAASNEIEPRKICLLRLDGSQSDLCDGDDPLVIPQLKSILFEGEDREWFLCGLDGSYPVKFADGMKGWGNPAISPDGKEMLWVRYAKGELPNLHLFPIQSTKGQPVTSAPGFTSIPTW